MKRVAATMLAALAVLLAGAHSAILEGEPDWWHDARNLMANQETAAEAHFLGWVGGGPIRVVRAADVVLKPLRTSNALEAVEGGTHEARRYVVVRLPGGRIASAGGFSSPSLSPIWDALVDAAGSSPDQLLLTGRGIAELGNQWSSKTVLPRKCIANLTSCPDTATALMYLRSGSAMGVGDTVVTLRGLPSRYLIQIDALYQTPTRNQWIAQHWTFLADDAGHLLAWTRSGAAPIVLARSE